MKLFTLKPPPQAPRLASQMECVRTALQTGAALDDALQQNALSAQRYAYGRMLAAPQLRAFLEHNQPRKDAYFRR